MAYVAHTRYGDAARDLLRLVTELKSLPCGVNAAGMNNQIHAFLVDVDTSNAFTTSVHVALNTEAHPDARSNGRSVTQMVTDAMQLWP